MIIFGGRVSCQNAQTEKTGRPRLEFGNVEHDTSDGAGAIREFDGQLGQQNLLVEALGGPAILRLHGQSQPQIGVQIVAAQRQRELHEGGIGGFAEVDIADKGHRVATEN